MAGYSTKRRTKINPKGFKKTFSFKQQQQQQQQQVNSSHHTSGASSAPVSARRCSFSSDDDTSICSSTIDTEGLLIFPSVQRLTASSPPLTILDGIHGLPSMNEGKKSDGFLSIGLARRSTGSKVSHLSSSSHSAPQARAPYQSKKAQKNLQPALKTYRRKSDYAKNHMNNSAWERRQPTSTIRREGSALSRSRSGRTSAVDERQLLYTETRDVDANILHTGSSNSFNLPAEVSPANRFVPIGYEEDHDIFSFNSDDYDICKVSMSEAHSEKPQPAAKAVVKKPVSSSKKTATTSSAKGSTSKAQTKAKEDFSCDQSSSHQTSHDGECYGGKQLDRQPSLASTEASTYVASIRSSEAAKRKRRADKYSVPSDKYDCGPLVSDGDIDWFPSIAHEIMKISSFFTSSCGATGSDTS